MDVRTESKGKAEWNGDGKERCEDEFDYIVPQC
jgi:hypothetical protein